MLVLACALAGCAGERTRKPFTISLRGVGTACITKVQGRTVTMDELLAMAAPAAKIEPRAHVRTDASVSYRCIAGLIYRLQHVGFEWVDVGPKPGQVPIGK